MEQEINIFAIDLDDSLSCSLQRDIMGIHFYTSLYIFRFFPIF